MAYRSPAGPTTPQLPPEVLEYEQQLIKRGKRKKIIVALVIGTLFTIGAGSCVGPLGVTIASEAWHARKTKLTPEEQKRVTDLLDPIETNAKKSQAAFDAIWPRIRGSEIGARRDLGACRVVVPGPTRRTKDASRSLADSSAAYGWTFIDLTPPDKRSPIEHLGMPAGSIPLNTYGGSSDRDRYVLPDRALKTAPPEKAPELTSTAMGPRAAELRAESAKGIRADGHKNYLQRVASFAEDGLGIDVIVFVDHWEDPKMTSEMAPAPPPPKNDYEAFTKPAPRPTHIFESGLAMAHAVAWNPSTQEVACASQAAALSSEHITFRSNDVAPLRRDLVLELEHELDRNFVAAGDAPPKLERPPPSTLAALEALVNQMEEASDAGTRPDAGAAKTGGQKTKKRPKAP